MLAINNNAGHRLFLLAGFLLLCLQTWAAPPALKTINELPPGIPSCKVDDPHLNDCIRKGVQFVVGKLKTGIPEINFPVMDPLELEKVNFQFSNNLLQGKIGLRSLFIEGLSAIQVQDVDYQNKNNALRLVAKGTLPQLHLHGNHRANVDAGNSKITSKGDFDLTLKDVVFLCTLEGHLTERDGHQYLTVTKVDLDPTVGGLKLQATGLLPEPSLNDAIVDSINQNWDQFYKVLLEDAHQNWEPLIIKQINLFSSYLPFDLLMTKA